MKNYLLAATLLCSTLSLAQNVGINTTGAAPHASAILDVSSTSRGVLFPRMTMANRDAIVNPATGLIVFQTDLNYGYYFNYGVPGAPVWLPLAHSKNAWSLTGNSGTNPSQHFLGTTDIADLHFRLNNQDAGYLSIGGSNFLGYRAGWLNTSNTNTGFGHESLYSTSNKNYNSAFGYFSLHNSTGEANTAMGYSSLALNTSGQNNVAIGYNAMAESGYSLEAVAVGAEALKKNSTANTPFSNEGRYNTALGTRALTENTSGNSNTATGWQSLRSNTSGSFNTATGMQALIANTLGNHNTGSGAYALFSNTTGLQNTAVGSYSLLEAVAAFDNTAIGHEALRNSTQSNNTGVGAKAGLATTTGDGNTFVGAYAAQNNTTGRLNVAVGRYALNNNTSGQQITALGIGAEVGADGLYNATSVGAFSRVDCSHCLVLGAVSGVNGAIGNVNVGVGVNAPTARMHIKTNSTTVSDKQLLLEENDNDYARIAFKNTSSANFWDIATYSAGNADVSRMNFFFSPSGDALSLFGNGNAVLKGTLTQLSDQRLKSNILPITSSLTSLSQLNGYTYNWLESAADPRLQYGLLAQEVQKVFPQLVSENEKGQLGVNYIGLVPVMISAIKEQQQQIVQQNAVIESLLKRVEAIEKAKQ